MRNSASILVGLGLVPLFTPLFGCSSSELTIAACETDADCPKGATCDPAEHVCLAPVVHSTGSSSGHGGATTSGSTGAVSSTSSSASGSTSGATTSSGSGTSGSSSGAATSSTSSSGSVGTSGTIGPQGGSVSALSFAVVGDTRPQNQGDTAGYPTGIITDIYADINGLNPEFVIATGDYAYCSGSDCAAQTANYLTAAKQYKAPGTSTQGQIFLAMGNHECNGFTASNCASDNYLDGVKGPTANFTNFLSMLNTFGINSTTQPTLATGNPYYEVDVSSSDSSNPWTAKFVFIAANAWDSGQSTWLSGVMNSASKKTTYTFVIRHESWADDGNASSNQPGDQGASDQIINSSTYGYTLLLVGHTHEYAQSKSGSGQVELIVGNGGAETSGPAGFVMCTQQSNGNISCQPYSSSSTSNPATNGAAVVVNAAGALQ